MNATRQASSTARRRPRVLLALLVATVSLLAGTISASAGAYDPPFPYEGYHNFPGIGASDNGYYRFPYSTIGKFYYTDQGVNKVCSGSVVNGPKSGGIVFTAAHCLYNAQAGAWTTNWAFAPAFDNGNAPFGLWSSWKQGEIAQAYFRGDLQYAYGFVTFNPNSNGQTLLATVGGLGLVLNASYLTHWHAYGYPDSDTNRQWVCTASWAASDIPSNSGEPPTLGIGCNRQQGMGGGPWLMQTKPGDMTAYLNSVTIYTLSSNDLYGDYFDSFAGTLFGDAESGKCSC